MGSFSGRRRLVQRPPSADRSRPLRAAASPCPSTSGSPRARAGRARPSPSAIGGRVAVGDDQARLARVRRLDQHGARADGARVRQVPGQAPDPGDGGTVRPRRPDPAASAAPRAPSNRRTSWAGRSAVDQDERGRAASPARTASSAWSRAPRAMSWAAGDGGCGRSAGRARDRLGRGRLDVGIRRRSRERCGRVRRDADRDRCRGLGRRTDRDGCVGVWGGGRGRVRDRAGRDAVRRPRGSRPSAGAPVASASARRAIGWSSSGRAASGGVDRRLESG